MRKITPFLSSILMVLGWATQVAQAQVTCVDLSSVGTGESITVIMHVGGEGVDKYIGTFTQSGAYYNDGKDGLTETPSEYMYTITKVSKTTINIKDSHNGYLREFLTTTNNQGEYVAKGNFTNTGSASSTFTFTVVDSPVSPLDGSSPAYTLTNSASNGAAIQYMTTANRLGVNTGTPVSFQFIEASSKIAQLTLNCTDSNNGQYSFSKSVCAWIGASIADLVTAALSSAPSDTYTLNSTHDGTVTEDAEVDIQVTSTYTFPVKMNTPYLMQCRYKTENGSKIFPYYMQRISDSDINTCAVSESFNLNQIWFFERVSTSPNEVVLRNMGKSVGGVYYGVTATNGKASVSANPTAYVLGIHSQNTDAITIRTAGSAYLGGHSSTVIYKGWNARLGTWGDSSAPTDPGSAFKVTEVSWEELATAAGNDKNVALASDYLTKYISADYIAALQSKSDEVTIENVASVFSDATYGFTLDTDKYYLIYSGKDDYTSHIAYADPRANKEGVPQDNNRKCFMASDAKTPMALMKFEATGEVNKYYIQHVNSGLYFSQTKDNNQVDLPLDKYDADTYTFESTTVADDLWGIKGNMYGCYLNIFSSRTPAWLGVWHDNANSDTGSRLRIKAVDEIPVTLSSAGWSTMTLPVAVTIPSGVRAYYVTRNVGADIYVEEITGVIPANTPVLLNGTASTAYNFGITTSDATAPANNKLLGTTMARTGFSTDTGAAPDVYGLYVDETTASFVPAFSATIPANKAVLPYANIDTEGLTSEETAAMRLVFDNVTGIAGVNVNSSETDYYDLQGRRVLYPVRGQVYIKNGQKVILK